MASNLFPFFTLRGSPKQIGLQHGRLLKDRIQKNVDIYKRQFCKTDEWIQFKATQILNTLDKYVPDIAEEIRGIAEGSGQSIVWITALNSRTEFIFKSSAKNMTECTTICFPKAGILAQTWDWLKVSQDLAVLLLIEKEGSNHKILTFTEPGIVAKIGMNSSGLGVTLNMLLCDELEGIIPVHVLLRVALECNSLDQFREFLGKVKPYHGTCSAVVVASKNGNFLHYEFMNNVSHVLSDTKLTSGGQEVFYRTNHFLSPVSISKNSVPPPDNTTWNRFTLAEKSCLQLTKTNVTSAKMVLQAPVVCQPWTPHVFRLGDLVGTVVIVVMDLTNMEMHYTYQREVVKSEFKTINLFNFLKMTNNELTLFGFM